jgi:integrase/recombinase XerD
MLAQTALMLDRMRRDMHVLGLSERTQFAYSREVRNLAVHYQVPPDQLTNAQIQDYLISLKAEGRLAPASIKMALHGIRCFLRHTVKRDPESLPYMRFRTEKRLPHVLTIEEVRELLQAERQQHYRTFFWTVYSLGLRLSEALYLERSHIDAGRMLVHVHRGKGGVDRFVPMPTRTLELLSAFWNTHRNPTWMFPRSPHDPRSARVAQNPMTRCCVHDAIRRVRRRIGLTKRASIHTLRHSYATHLLEAGVPTKHVAVRGHALRDSGWDSDDRQHARSLLGSHLRSLLLSSLLSLS